MYVSRIQYLRFIIEITMCFRFSFKHLQFTLKNVQLFTMQMIASESGKKKLTTKQMKKKKQQNRYI